MRDNVILQPLPYSHKYGFPTNEGTNEDDYRNAGRPLSCCESRGGTTWTQAQGPDRGGITAPACIVPPPSASNPRSADEGRPRNDRFRHSGPRLQSRASCKLGSKCTPQSLIR